MRFDLLNLTMPRDKKASRVTEKELYQLIISRLDGEEFRTRPYREKILGLVRKGIGGFIIFGGEKGEVKSFVGELQSVSEAPLFIASDVERGVGQQVQGATVFPCQMALAAVDQDNTGSLSLLRSVFGAVADEAKDIGINMPLIPVIDVNRDPNNPIICTRAFSDNPEAVARFGSECIKILELSGLISCAKHFPGHGDTSVDSHMALPVIKKPLKDLIDVDIMPFAKAIDTGVSSIMVGHLSIPVLDDRPASLSKKIVGILRESLGFAGLIVTDALSMDALKEIGNVPIECLKAGADILLHPADPDMTVKELMPAVESGEIVRHVEAAIDRISQIKRKIKKIEGNAVDYQGNERLSVRVTEMSISLLKYTPGLLPITNQSGACLIFAGDSEAHRSSPLRRYFKNCLSLSEMAKKLPFHLVKGGCPITIFAIFTSVSAWKGSSGISEDEKKRVRALIKKTEGSVVISFGSPYVLRHFKEADVLISAYEATEQAQKAVLKCIEGSLDFRGRIPVKI